MNYSNNIDYYNYENNNYNKPVYNQKNDELKKTFDPYNGFIRGNLFPELYNGYKLEKPLEIIPLNEQADLLTYIDALCFTLIDLNLYLDIYPNDNKMINLYNNYLKEKEEMVNEYDRKFGALTLDSKSLNKTPWSWSDNPWPWEGM